MTTTKNINVGDTVFANFSKYTRTIAHTGIVKAKSPTGVIRVAFPHGDFSFLATGRQRGADYFDVAQLVDETVYRQLDIKQKMQSRCRLAHEKIKEAAATAINASTKQDVLRKLHNAIMAVEAI